MASRTISSLGNVLHGELLQFQELGHGGKVDRLARFRDNDGTGALAQPFIRVSDDGDLGDRGVPVQQRLDLDDGYVLAASDDDVLAATADADIAVGVHVREIAGVEPAVGIRPVPLRTLQIAAEIRAGANDEPADLSGRQRSCLRRR